MGGLTRLVLVSMLFGCTPVDCDIVNMAAPESIEHISLFNSNLEKRSRDATVRITSFDEHGNRVRGSGAYIVYKGGHYILTAAHVIDGSPTAMIEGYGETIIGEVAYTDIDTDVALISIAGMITKDPLRWRVSKDHDIGDELIYSGYPNSVGMLTIKGSIAGYDGSMVILHSYVWKGASGSAVLDSQGRIIGVVSAVDVGTDIVGFPTIIEDVGFVVPVFKVEEFLKNK